MMKFAIAALALCFAAWGQSENLLKITPKQDHSATGEIRFFELFTNGQNYIGLKAPVALAGNTPYTLPTAHPVTTGECLTSTTAGVTSWAACDSLWSVSGADVYRSAGGVGIGGAPAVALDIMGGAAENQIRLRDSTNTTDVRLQAFNGYSVVGNVGAHPLVFITNNVERARFNGTGGMLMAGSILSGTDAAYDLGAPGFTFGTVYTHNADFAPPGVVNNYTKVRKLEVAGSTGETTFWDVQAAASMAANSWFKVRDNAGSRLFLSDRATSGTPLNSTRWFTTFVPAKRAIADGDAVDDSVFPDLGGSSARWATAYVGVLDATSSNALLPNGTVSLGASGSDWNRLWVGGVEVTSFVRPQADNGGTDGTSARRWSAGYWYDGDFADVLAVGGGAAGFYDALNLRNTTVGAYGSCVVMSATDTVGSTVYGAGRICGRYTSNSFSNEEVTIQTATGSGTYQNAITITNDDVTIADTLFLPSGAGIAGQSGSGTVFESGSSFVVNAGATLAFNAAIDSNLHPAADDLYSLGEAATPRRWKDVQTYGLTVVGPASITGGLTVSGGCTGCSSLPVADTTAIVKGSVDATKLLAFEVDGFTTATTRTLTPQNASYTIAGIDIAQTFTSAQTFNSNLNSSDLIPRSDLTYVVGNGGARYSTGHFNNILIYNELQAFSSTASIGSLATPFGGAHINTLNIYATIVPDTTNSRNFGSATRIWNKVFTKDIRIDGAVTAPDGNAGQSATITVRDAAGTGTCTLIFSGGFKTGGTC